MSSFAMLWLPGFIKNKSGAIDRAEHIKKLFEKSASAGINGFMDDLYGFIDEPIYRDAIQILKKRDR